MRIERLVQPPLNTTLMGVVRGVADSLDRGETTPWLYGATGHAFAVNVHEELCPSGPYCWNQEPFDRLLGNLGVRRNDLGFYVAESSEGERRAVEEKVRAHLDRGLPAALSNMENQLITGYDETGFETAQPWPGMDFPPAHLTFGTWEELGDEVHANFFTFEPTEPADERRTARESIEFAIDLASDPGKYTSGPYGFGPDAWRNWITAVKAGLAGTHGNWWNATVWGECRRMAGAYLGEIAERFPEARAAAVRLAARFEDVARALEGVADRERDADTKLLLLLEAAEEDREGFAGLGELLESL